jgi:hypothetical protein
MRLMYLLYFGAAVGLLWGPPGTPAAAVVPATSQVSSGQKTAALEFLAAVASGDPQAVASTLHPDDLQALRLRTLNLLHDEAKRGDSTIRSRLFGPGMPLEEIDRLTDTGFYGALARKLYVAGREYSEVEGLAAIPDKGQRVDVVVRGRQPRDHGKVQIVTVVALKSYGKDWKAALPGEIEAQIDDLIEGRHPALRPVTGAQPVGGAAAVTGQADASGATAAVLPAIAALLGDAEQSLQAGRCADYYSKQMSPNFRRVTGKKALEALVASCQNSMGTRQLLLSTLHIVRGLEPRYANDSQRAVYDLSGQGLPYQTFTLEQVDKHWYVAE